MVIPNGERTPERWSSPLGEGQGEEEAEDTFEEEQEEEAEEEEEEDPTDFMEFEKGPRRVCRLRGR